MMIISSLISVISSIVGMYFSYIYNIPSGATIVLCAFIIYIIIFTCNKMQFFTKKEQFNEKLLTITMILLLFLSACGKGNNDSNSQSHEK